MELEIRYTKDEDAPFLRDWFQDPAVLRNFPMQTALEVTDTINRWMSYNRFGCSITALDQKRPVAMTLFWLQFYQKIRHEALFTLIVDPQYRGRGIGGKLLQTLLDHGKEHLGVSVAHLEVYEGNPAIRLYERMGFREVGMQKKWVKDQGEYIGRIMMQKEL